MAGQGGGGHRLCEHGCVQPLGENPVLSCLTAMDIAEDMLVNGVQPVVMVQRSSTHVIPAEHIAEGYLCKSAVHSR